MGHVSSLTCFPEACGMCSMCGEWFQSKMELSRHRETHEIDHVQRATPRYDSENGICDRTIDRRISASSLSKPSDSDSEDELLGVARRRLSESEFGRQKKSDHVSDHDTAGRPGGHRRRTMRSNSAEQGRSRTSSLERNLDNYSDSFPKD